jgi:hypothetical protein
MSGSEALGSRDASAVQLTGGANRQPIGAFARTRGPTSGRIPSNHTPVRRRRWRFPALMQVLQTKRLGCADRFRLDVPLFRPNDNGQPTGFHQYLLVLATPIRIYGQRR